MKSILVPLDGSAFGERALPWAAALAERSGSPLHLAHVHVAPPREELLTYTQFQYEGVTLREYEERDLSEERSYLDEVAARVHAPVVPAVLEGRVVPAVEEYAAEVDAGLIAMSTHGRTGVSRLWLGSVADELVRSTSRPVLAVHPGADGRGTGPPSFEHMLVPLDGSPASEAILVVARELGRIMESRFTLVGVVSPNVILGARTYPVPAGRLEERNEKVQAYLDSVAEELRREGFRVDARATQGQTPAGAILEKADELGATLIAMARHGYGGLSRTVLGSVSDKVLRGGRRPVLLLRPQM